MNLAVNQRRAKLAEVISEVVEVGKDETIVAAAKEWLANKDDAEGSRKAGEKLVAALEAKDGGADKKAYILENKDLLTKKSIWIFGGDGWAYDIGYGGVDHVLAQNQDVNILVLDTEVYSNTGGQASKASPTGAVAKFAAAGKRTKKKDLGLMAMSYGYVYVAQVAMSNLQQVVKAMTEAEAYNGPSLIIAYAPCINHGLRAKGGMGKAQAEIKKAVDCGYWQLYRYNPTLENPMTVDSKDPTGDYQEFLKGEVRYTSLAQQFPDAAAKLFVQQEEDAKVRRESYKKMAAQGERREADGFPERKRHSGTQVRFPGDKAAPQKEKDEYPPAGRLRGGRGADRADHAEGAAGAGGVHHRDRGRKRRKRIAARDPVRGAADQRGHALQPQRRDG